MKKILFILICCLCLCGCGKQRKEKVVEKETKTESSMISESELNSVYSYEQVNYYCFLHTYSNGKIISSQSFRFYFDEKGNTTKYLFTATYSNGTNERFWKEPDTTCDTYLKINVAYNNSSWTCGIFLNN